MLPPDARKHSIRSGSSRGIVELRDAICPRYGSRAGGEIRGNVRQPLHRGLRGTGTGGGAETAGHGFRGRPDPAPRYGRVRSVKPTLAFLLLASLAFSQDVKQRARSA